MNKAMQNVTAPATEALVNTSHVYCL